MTSLKGKVVTVHAGRDGILAKPQRESIEVRLDGIVGDRHRGTVRQTWEDDKQPEGTARRNERMWSAVSLEELGAITDAMDLATPLSAATLGANLCLSGIADLSRLPRGTILRVPSGAELMVEEYNPPCLDMGELIARSYRTRTGPPPAPQAFPTAAKFLRGIVGVIEVAGMIEAGDEVTVQTEVLPKWLRR